MTEYGAIWYNLYIMADRKGESDQTKLNRLLPRTPAQAGVGAGTEAANRPYENGRLGSNEERKQKLGSELGTGTPKAGNVGRG